MVFGETAEVEDNRSPMEWRTLPTDESDPAAAKPDEFGGVTTKKVKFEEGPEEADDILESWDDHDSFPEFPPGEIPDFLIDIAAKRDSSRRRSVQDLAALPLYKQRSWSIESNREETWLRRKENSMRRSKSVTDEDLNELRGCIELGFRFDNRVDRTLSGTLPALDLFHADCVSGSSASDSSGSPIGSPQSFFCPDCPLVADIKTTRSPQTIPVFRRYSGEYEGENPQMVKARLKQWAQVVACSVQHFR